MSPLDAAMLLFERPQMPMYIGGAAVFTLPQHAGPDFVRQLYDRWLAVPVTRSPLNYRRAPGSITSPVPAWEVLEHVDVGQHLFRVALPHPGGDRELTEMVERLQSAQLDPTRPLWQVHLIEGLRGSRFALHLMLHHALADGLNTMRIFLSPYSEDPAAIDNPPPWAATGHSEAFVRKSVPDSATLFADMARYLASRLGSSRRLREDITNVSLNLRALADPAIQELGAPDTLLNGPITSRRVTDAVILDLARLRELAQLGGGTVNDVALAVCSGALRRYLQGLGQLPEESLRCLVPVAFRGADRPQVGNAVSAVTVTLGTNIADPMRRFAAIRDATRAGKESMRAVASDTARLLHGARLMLPLALRQLSGIRGLVRLPFNLAISNVPGPRQKLYLYGAEMQRIVSSFIISDGMALSILLTSYHDQLYITFTACPDTLPRIDRFTQLLRDSCAELEHALRGRGAGSGARRRRSARK